MNKNSIIKKSVKDFNDGVLNQMLTCVELGYNLYDDMLSRIIVLDIFHKFGFRAEIKKYDFKYSALGIKQVNEDLKYLILSKFRIEWKYLVSLIGGLGKVHPKMYKVDDKYCFKVKYNYKGIKKNVFLGIDDVINVKHCNITKMCFNTDDVLVGKSYYISLYSRCGLLSLEKLNKFLRHLKVEEVSNLCTVDYSIMSYKYKILFHDTIIKDGKYYVRVETFSDYGKEYYYVCVDVEDKE